MVITALVLAIGAIGTLAEPYRYDSGFKLWAFDINGMNKNISNFTYYQPSYPIVNVSDNYSVSADSDYTILVDASKVTGSLNLSFEHPANQSRTNNTEIAGRGREYKILRISQTGNVQLESARNFIGNSSNSSEKWNGNIFYFNFTASGMYNFTQAAIKLYSVGTGCCIRLAVYNDTGGKPGTLQDQSSNMTTINTGWTQVTGFNGTFVLQPATQYWVAFQTNDSTIVPYAAGNKTAPTSTLVYNQGYAYSTFKTVASNLAHNTTPGQLVPNIAVNMAYIDNVYQYNITEAPYTSKWIQSDGSRWW